MDTHAYIVAIVFIYAKNHIQISGHLQHGVKLLLGPGLVRNFHVKTHVS